ncbi:motility associated factor glycosyltransferase family protein [Bermanella sp. R86531]|uniref:motility associated factor glycosyltransferase family protein n=1 Tax=Bermanella sp. R86531 TaxID=3093849 RepID=UPI0037C8E498
MRTKQDLLNTYEKNLEFFKTHLTPIYNAIEPYEFKRCRIEAFENGELDLIDNGKSLYRKQAIDYAKKESNKFLKQLAPGAPITTITPPHIGNYSGKRLYFESIDKTIQRLYSIKPYTGEKYYLRNFLPMVVFTGVGLGLHIQELLKNKEVLQIYVVEHDIEHFKASMYVTRWYEIVPEFDLLKGRMLNFVLTFGQEEEEIFVNIWNELLRYPPRFPLTTIYYNHRRSKLYEKTIKRIQSEFHVFISSWGFYDDEINQLNNGIHNLREGIPFISKSSKDSISDEERSIPALVVGAGPSLNDKIDFIKENKDDFLIISAGTALRSLYKAGITPDIHAEIESDYNTVLALNSIDPDYLKDIKLIGPIQLNPLAFKKFNTKRLFFKDSSAQSGMFEISDTDPIPHSTPTCSNTAMAFLLYHEFKDIYFVGMDLGYKDKSNSHAQGSLYYEQDAPDQIKQAMKAKEFTDYINILDVNGGTIKTEPIYFSTKRRIENAIRTSKSIGKETDFYNASNGAEISGAPHIKEIALNKNINYKNLKDSFINKVFFENNIPMSEDDIKNGVDRLLNFISDTKGMIVAVTQKMDGSVISLDKAVLIMAHQLDTQQRVNNKLYYFIRGTCWHFMFSIYGHIYAQKLEQEDNKKLIEEWCNNFHAFLNNIEDHIKVITSRKLSLEEDDWLTKSIRERVSGPQFEDYDKKGNEV